MLILVTAKHWTVDISVLCYLGPFREYLIETLTIQEQFGKLKLDNNNEPLVEVL